MTIKKTISSVAGMALAVIMIAGGVVGVFEVEKSEAVVTGNISPCGSLGDVNNDGYLTNDDTTILENYIVGSATLTDSQKTKADVNGDGKVSSADSQLIKQYMNGSINTFAACVGFSPCGSLGDVNNDGYLTNDDTTILENYIVGSATLTDSQKTKADVNGDGKVSSADSQLIKQYMNGSINTFAACVSITCADTDGGKDYYVKGIVNGSLPSGLPVTKVDTCTNNNNKVLEYFCLSENNPDYFTGALSVVSYTCPNGCKDGACIVGDEELPDLVVESISVNPSTPVINQKFSAKVTVRNDGNRKVWEYTRGLTTPVTFLTCKVIQDNVELTWNTQSKGFGHGGMETLEPGQSKTYTFSDLEIKSTKLSNQIQCVIDPDNKYEELNEENNEFNAFFSIGCACTDTDGGKNYYVKGTCTGNSVFPEEGWTSKTDYCIQKKPGGTFNLNYNLKDPYLAGQVTECGTNCAVQEYFCSDAAPYINSLVSSCPNGCKDGACVKDKDEIIPDSDLSDSSCLPDGTLIKIPGDPRIYVIENCKKKWIKTAGEFERNNYKWSDVKDASKEVVNAYADYLKATANLLRAIGHSKVYRVIDGKRLWVPTASAFNAQGLKWDEIEDASETEVNQYPEAKLLQVDGDQKIYYITGAGLKRHIPNSQVFLSYGNSWNDVVKVSNTELNAYSDNTLIKAEGDYKVYKLENGKKRWIKTAGAFNRMRYNWSGIGEVNGVELGAYADGGNIE